MNYSDAVLAKRDIQSISMDQEALDKVYNLIISNTYNSAGAQVGSEIPLTLGARRGITGMVENIRQYTVTYEEFPEIQKLFREGGFDFLDYEFTSTSKALLFFSADGSLTVVTHSFELRTPSSDWDRKDIDQLVQGDGPGYLFAQITTSAIYGNQNLTNKRTLITNPVWLAMGCNDANGWCQISGTDKIDVIFNN